MPLTSAIAIGDSDTARAGDTDGDGVSDITVYNPSTSYWYTLTSTSLWESVGIEATIRPARLLVVASTSRALAGLMMTTWPSRSTCPARRTRFWKASRSR